MKKAFEFFQRNTFWAVLLAIGLFSSGTWIWISVQGCQLNRRLDSLETRLERIEAWGSRLGDQWELGRAEEFNDGGIPGMASQSPLASVDSAPYCASKNSKVFHYPSCEMAQKINPKNLIRFKTREEAIRSGRRPCRVCRP